MVSKQGRRDTVSEPLDAALDAYFAAVKPRTADWKDSLGTWPMYAVATGSALAFATSASASTIVYSGPVDRAISIVSSGALHHSAGMTVNIDGHNFTFHIHRTLHHIFYGGGSQRGSANMGGASVLDDNFSHSARRLAYGAQISTGEPFVGVFGANQFFFHKTGYFSGIPLTSTKGEWARSGIAFAGIRVQNGGSDLGWIRIRLGASNATSGYVNEVEVIDWAYNSAAGASITAGETGLPEPTSRAMALLALGAAGVLAWRKRRPAAEPRS